MKTLTTQQTWTAKDGQVYDEKTGKTIAVIPYFDKELREDLRNQKLMAAAPEMLETLKHIAERLQTIIINNKKRNENDPFLIGFSKALRDRSERIINDLNHPA